ncbi:run domain Beclin-1-interacting and cysteine-rich domain-containing protein rubicon [Lycorma delicatula]|uniref:run domain Beclin-1-interacting and cysteine-rich domain-containing protein rubicon n=1 Tax=Lycorma delicatula TaxID=130591 RepID=UPI003F50FED2
MEESHQHLLQQLKMTVEGLLITQPTNVWHVYGGLNRLYSVLERIFKHGCRVYNQDGEPDCWVFIQGLSWLQPSLAASPTFIGDSNTTPHSPNRPKDKAKAWLYKSLESHSLSQKLAWLLTDREHLSSCFKSNAFLCQEKYSEATLICLQAVEQNQLSLLTDIDPSLYLLKWNVGKSHRRCASFPDGIRMIREADKSNTETKKESNRQIDVNPAYVSSSLSSCKSCVTNSNKTDQMSSVKKNIFFIHKPWQSLPCLSDISRTCNDEKPAVSLKNKCRTQPSSPAITPLTRVVRINSERLSNSGQSKEEKISPSVLKIDYKELQKNDFPSKISSKCKLKSSKNNDIIFMKDVPKSDPVPIEIACSRLSSVVSPRCSGSSGGCDSFVPKQVERKLTKKKKKECQKLFNVPHSIWEESDDHSHSVDIKHSTVKANIRSNSKTAVIRSAPEQRWKVTRKKSFIEDGGNSVQPMSTRYFPRPTQGQSLASFLSSSQFTRANAELDRENAHFSISEAIIAAIEQMKCNRWMGLVEENVEESDEEINNLKQRIRLRRRQKQEEKHHTLALLSDGKTDTTTTDQSASPFSSSPEASSDCLSTDDVDDLELDQVTSSNLEHFSKSGLSVSMASLYSEAEISRPSTAAPTTEAAVSAEGVALSLLRQFSDKHLPRASDLQWLVSEQDAPQQLLPLPKSWPVSPDEAEDQDMRQATSLRGTTDWAPPRPQIIFTAHPTPVRRVLMTKQNYRCAGCGMKVQLDYAHKYRYCEYLGRFFCTGCHTNQFSIIPGRVLTKWDFNQYPVSNFSFRLLDQMFSDPLFNVNDLNPRLYRRAHCLEKIRFLRLQLFYLKDFLLTCRFAEELREVIQNESPYVFMEPDVYSLQDFLSAKSGELGTRLKDIINSATAHIKNCQLCQVRGFVCEVCRSQEVIYPWELDRVVRCASCGACFHNICYSPKLACPRCIRISKRRISEVSVE